MAAERDKKPSNRILLDENAAALVAVSVEHFKSLHCSLTPSKLVSKIVEMFFIRDSESDANEIKDAFFDRKAYLKSVLSSAKTDDELTKALAQIVNEPKEKRRRKRKFKSEDELKDSLGTFTENE